MKTKIFCVVCDYDLNKHRMSACDLAGDEFFIRCKIDELPKKLYAAIVEENKRFDWKDSESLEISFSKTKSGKPDYEHIEVRTVGEKWKPQILQVFEETLYS